jgi:cyclophilin family peptidyl-prolyl cis-trans isomerase
MNHAIRPILAMLAILLAAPAGAEGGPPRVLIQTNLGEITAELYPEQAPATVDNFLRYVKSGFYNGTLFHRVVEGFMIQGGGYTRAMTLKTPLYPPIKLEARSGLKNQRGTLAMARTNAADSATCQFFINVVDNPFLDYDRTTNPSGYAVFGRVVGGMDVVDQIRAVKVTANPTDIQGDGSKSISLPVTPVVIESMRLLPLK